MKHKAIVTLAVLVLVFGSAMPSFARGGGRSGGGHVSSGHSGGRFHGGHFRGGFRGHGGFHHGGCCWWGPAFVGGVALGTALAYPYYAYPWDLSYGYPYEAYPDPVYFAPPVAEQAPAAPPAVQREVVYPHGKYVLYGDGVNQPWQWVWVPADPTTPTRQ